MQEVLTALQLHWPELNWELTDSPQPHEATLLYLDPSKAKENLDWRPIWSLDRALQITADWYRSFSKDGVTVTAEQLKMYVEEARTARVSWVSE